MTKVLQLGNIITMNGLTTITTKGQVTIPGKVREALGVKVGDKVYFGEVFPEKRQALIKVVPKDIVDQLYGSLKSKKKFIDINKVRKNYGKMLAERYDLK